MNNAPAALDPSRKLSGRAARIDPQLPSPEIASGPFDAAIADAGFVFEPLARWARETPEKSALISTAASYTYSEIEDLTDRIACRLSELGVMRGDRVGLVLSRGHEAVLAIISVLKAGAAYVPLDSGSPFERIRQCLEDASPRVVIVDWADRLAARTEGCEVIEISRLLADAQSLGEDFATCPETGLQPSDLAYIIFTSGTTGRPKGVPITHAGLTNFVFGDQQACMKVEPHDRVLQGFSPASDGHVEEIWPTFLAGATLVVATPHEIHSGHELGAFLNRHGVTMISCAPTLLSMVEENVPSLRRILFGAERCPAELVRRWWTPDREIINTYGPTEASVGATYSYCNPDEPITIGRPLPNYFCYILDEELRAVDEGEEGELCISGIGISPGYMGSAASGSDKFIRNPFGCAEKRNQILYRTGDRARLRPDGQIEWLGRIDAQIKIRGYRIEVSDIESHIMQDPAVRSAVVILRNGNPPTPSLAALLVARSGSTIDPSACFDRLRRELPAYMVPQTLEQVESIPVLPSGKVDRRACQDLKGSILEAVRNVVEPKTDTERVVLDAWQSLFPGLTICCTDDFFHELGGYSLLATHCVSTLRGISGMGMVSVMDLYENPTVQRLAALIDSRASDFAEGAQTVTQFAEVPRSRYLVATAFQGLGVLFLFGYRAAFWLAPVMCASYGVYLEWPHWKSVALGLFVHAISVPIGLLLAVALKWLVIGKTHAGKYPVWGGYFLRWWFVERMLDMAPRNYISGTPLASLFLRMLGAKVGRNCFFETLDVDCPDLITVGRDCVIEERAWIRGSYVSNGYLTIKPISIGDGCIVGVKSGVAGGAVLEDGAFLADLSCAGDGTVIPAGEEWEGSPARKRDWNEAPAYDPNGQPTLGRQVVFGWMQSFLALLLPLIDTVPFLCTTLLFYQSSDEFHTYLLVPVYSVLLMVASCVQLMALKWLIIGRMKPGEYRMPSGFTLRKWFVDKLIEVETSSIVPIYDTLYARPLCIALGMRCGPRCEIALPARMPYDLVELGEESFLCSDTSVGMPLRRNGTMVLERTTTGSRAFLGNDSVISQGIHWPKDSLLGALSASPKQRDLGTDSEQVWLGSPPTKLPARQHFEQFDDQQTYKPTLKMYAHRLIHETFRIILPGMASLLVAALMLNIFDSIWEARSVWAALLSIPILDVLAALVGLAALYGMKKALIGTYRPNIQPLWSPFVWKTETFATFLHDFAAPLFMAPLLGTPYLSSAFRFMGMKVGKRAFINTSDLTEFDLLSVGEDAALNHSAPLQAHLFEDRVMKLGRIDIGDRCSVGNYSVVLLESHLRPDGHVGNISLVMKGETIPSGTYWEGSPAQSRTTAPLKPENVPVPLQANPVVVVTPAHTLIESLGEVAVN